MQESDVFEQLVPKFISGLETYQAGRNVREVQREYGLEHVIKLASNENPWGPSPRAIEAVSKVLHLTNRYPDPTAMDLRLALAERNRLSPDNIIVGNGSEGIMAYLVRAMLHGDDEVITSASAFTGFSILCRTRNVEPVSVALKDYGFDLQRIADCITRRTKLIYLCNPNNPTGTFFTKEQFDAFVCRVPPRVLVILDEAYFEFARSIPEYPDSMDYRYDNVITLRTFSKAHGLAGFRVGYGFGHPHLIRSLWKVKLPFQPTYLAQVAALGALQDDEFVNFTVAKNEECRQALCQSLKDLGLRYLPSCTNFVTFFVPEERTAQEVYQSLLRQGVIIRPLDQAGLPDCLRISVGTTEEIQMCRRALESVLGAR